MRVSARARERDWEQAEADVNIQRRNLRSAGEGVCRLRRCFITHSSMDPTDGSRSPYKGPHAAESAAEGSGGQRNLHENVVERSQEVALLLQHGRRATHESFRLHLQG